MTQTINDLFKTIHKNGTLVTHQETDQGVGLTHTFCSVFIKKKNILIKGERDNPKLSKRNAVFALLDPQNNEVLGGF